MPDMPWFKLALLNRAANDAVCARIATTQVPAEGQLIYAHGGGHTTGTPFENQRIWRVEQVLWWTSSAGSHNAIQWALDHREGLGMWDGGVCKQAELLVWPATHPSWPERPKWAWCHPQDEQHESGASVNP